MNYADHLSHFELMRLQLQTMSEMDRLQDKLRETMSHSLTSKFKKQKAE